MIFLLQYDRRRGELVSIRTFPDSERQAAYVARLDLELELPHDGLNHEATLLEAANEAAIRRTHRRYFESLDSLLHRPEAAA